MTDWGRGAYEYTARQLEPVSERVAESLGDLTGRRVLDLACGTGNASLAVARRAAEVTGLDASDRLVRVARARAAEAGVTAEFVVGDFHELPFEDNSFDVVVSVFGVIFADPATTVGAEIRRVLKPGGIAVVTGWNEAGPLHETMSKVAEFVMALQPPRENADSNADEKPRPPRWNTLDGLRTIFASPDLEPQLDEFALPTSAASTAEYVQEWFDHHPMWVELAEKIGPEHMAELEGIVLGLLDSHAQPGPDGRPVWESPYTIATIDLDG